MRGERVIRNKIELLKKEESDAMKKNDSMRAMVFRFCYQQLEWVLGEAPKEVSL